MQTGDHRHFMLQIALKCADICNPCRPWEVSRAWSLQVSEEFYRQGDLERRLGLPVTPLCDRFTSSVCKIQTGFFRFIAAPLFEEWHRFQATPLSCNMLNYLRSNKVISPFSFFHLYFYFFIFLLPWRCRCCNGRLFFSLNGIPSWTTKSLAMWTWPSISCVTPPGRNWAFWKWASRKSTWGGPHFRPVALACGPPIRPTPPECRKWNAQWRKTAPALRWTPRNVSLVNLIRLDLCYQPTATMIQAWPNLHLLATRSTQQILLDLLSVFQPAYLIGARVFPSTFPIGLEWSWSSDRDDGRACQPIVQELWMPATSFRNWTSPQWRLCLWRRTRGLVSPPIAFNPLPLLRPLLLIIGVLDAPMKKKTSFPLPISKL